MQMAKNPPDQNKAEEKTLTQYDIAKRDLLNNPFAAVIVLITGIVIGASQIPDAVNKLLVTFGVKPDALTLANNDAKSGLTRNLIELGYKRIFWIQNYYARYKRIELEIDSLGQSENKSAQIINRMVEKSDINLAWNEYIKTVEGWSMNLVINQQLIGKYYSDEKSQTFDQIHNEFQQIHEKLVSVRYKSMYKNETAKIFSEIKTDTEMLNTKLLFFVTGLEEDKKK